MTKPQKNLLDYFSMSSRTSESEEPSKKQKIESRRMIVESTSDSIEDIEKTDLFLSEDDSKLFLLNKAQISQTTEYLLSEKESLIETKNVNVNKHTNPNELDKITNEEPMINSSFVPRRISTIIADFINADTSEFNVLDTDASTLEQENKSFKEKNEERYEFLINIRDNNLIRKGSEGYDPSKLFIPEKYYQKFTAFEKQFWDIKKEYFDTVIFFKKGKFYELYEEDAEIASKLFDLRVSERVNMKMAGFPESSYDIWANKFIAGGYKIGRVEQAENAIGKKLREANSKKEKIIERQLTEVVTQGTIYNTEFLQNIYSQYLAIIVQNEHTSDDPNNFHQFSTILYDASINKIMVSTFGDSIDLNKIKSFFVQNNIKELISEINLKIPDGITKLKPIKDDVVSKRRFDFHTDEEFLCYSYLYNYLKLLCRESCLESTTITYESNDSMKCMCLDGSTLINLDILYNNFDKTENFTLFKAINYCSTPFGQRLLRKWATSPLTNINLIIERQIISQFFNNESLLVDLRFNLSNLGDFERFVGKLSTGTPSFKDLKNFNEGLRKIEISFILLFDYLKAIHIELINHGKQNANLNNEISSLNTSIKISILEDQIKLAEDFKTKITDIISNFDKTYKILGNEIIPGNENDELFVLNNEHQNVILKLNTYLDNLKRSLKTSCLCYKSVGKEVYQVEAPNNIVMPNGFYTVSTTKTASRYYSKELKALVDNLIECEEKVFQSQASILRRAVDFLKQYSSILNGCVYFLASIDCFISFSRFNKIIKGTMPIFFDNSNEESGRFVLKNFGNPVYPDYIRNDYEPEKSITLITGPNMGGKSTFLRSIALNIIIAQMGMFIPCDYAIMPVFDNLFTRIGASDSLAKGESTFMMELNETSKILNNCTSKSFIIMDELGRGTSTKDGEAIAKAVLDFISIKKSHTLFATHYHGLVNNSSDTNKLFPEFVFDNDDIVFLYKMKNGVCSDSHGLYVARLAGIPECVVLDAVDIRERILKIKTN